MNKEDMLEEAAYLLDEKLVEIEKAIRDYHYELDMRKHGGVAQSVAFNKICKIMNLNWVQNKERDERENKTLTP